MSNSNRFYLPNLNALRAFAAMMVVISHIESKMIDFGLKVNKPISTLGGIGVTLFFVLSGFLITYLLLVEKDRFSKINVKDFYFRRFLRIWPLYFLVLAIVYGYISYLLPEYYLMERERFTLKSLLLNTFFLTNVTIVLKLTPLIIATIWSIGVEEQFYIFWPWVIKSRNRILIILAIIILIPFLKVVLLLVKMIMGINDFKVIYDILNHTRFDSMAIGGFFGVLAFYKRLNVRGIILSYEVFARKKNQYAVYFFVLAFFIISQVYPKSFNFINFQILPILFAICILNLATNSKTIFSIENKIMNYLGKISYSLYLNHMVVIYLSIPILKRITSGYSNTVMYIMIYFFILLLVILSSYITYNFYEKQFLKFKKNFAHIKT